MSFASLGLSASILQAVQEQGYDTPSPIQAQAIPAVLEGRDVMAAAQTGTGKTAGFTLPLLERLAKGERAKANQVRALVLTPTRELAAQVAESVEAYGKYLPLSSAVVFGGVKINPQMMRLRKGADVLVATPGRLLDLYQQNAVRFQQLEVLVLDEADRMLDMGFIHDIKKILAILPKQRQNLMFSATFSDEIRALAKGLVNDPVEISVAKRNTTAESVTQWIYEVDKNHKPAVLSKLILDNNWEQVLVFTKTKHGANRLTKQLDAQGISAAAIHGNKSQGARTKALADFKDKAIRVLVATDIAARGLDIDQLPQVVNFELPNVPEDYVHRIGRTGRAGAVGQAVSLVTDEEFKLLAAIERLTNQALERRVLDGFVPANPLPPSRLDSRAPKPKKPKQPRTSGAEDGNSREARGGEGRGRSGGQRRGDQGRDGQRREGQARDDQRTEGQRREGQARDDQRTEGQRREGQRRDNPARDSQGRRNEPRRNDGQRTATPAGDNAGAPARRRPRRKPNAAAANASRPARTDASH